MTDASRLSANGLSVGFERRGDRIAHFVELVNGNAQPSEASPRRLWESIEGTASDAWPASPALQNLHVEERPGGVRVALLVGMAGSSHWSMSVEADPSRSELVFDVACRTRDEPVFMGSTYRLAADHPRPLLHDGRWHWASGPVSPQEKPVRLELTLDAAAGDASVDWQGQRLTISANAASNGKSQTYRWRYGLRVQTEKPG